MRKIAMVIALVAVLVALGASVVFAQAQQEGTTHEDGEFVKANNQVIHCHGVPCTASDNDDLV